MEKVSMNQSQILLDMLELQELESRLENRWVSGDCACICDCRTGKMPDGSDLPEVF